MKRIPKKWLCSLALLLIASRVEAHSQGGDDGHTHEQTTSWPAQLLQVAARTLGGSLSEGSAGRGVSARDSRVGGGPVQILPFEVFSSLVDVRWDQNSLYVESNGMPDHEVMVGIRRWIGRFPMPQNYRGKNAWTIPLHPAPARVPRSARTGFYRGAIAMASNGVPIFNPLTNGGRDTFLAGELDRFGGHAGNGEDYHYHIAPLHLQAQLGAALPIGYALDGYPIYGLTEPDGSDPGRLDALNGHRGPGGTYHYHASKTYPYVNGGFYGEVHERGGQVDPQPRSTVSRQQPFRADRDAVITGFKVLKPMQSYELQYSSRGQISRVQYAKEASGAWRFRFYLANGRTMDETIVERNNDHRRDPRNGQERRRRPRR
jgi:hypothetical protein